MNSKSEKKRIFLDYTGKVQLLEEFDVDKDVRAICNRYEISRSTLYRLVQTKEKIRQTQKNFEELGKVTNKNSRTGKLPQLEEALFQWVQEQRKINNILNGTIIKTKAEMLFKKLKELTGDIYENFEATDSWFQHFKKRFNLKFLSVQGGFLDQFYNNI